MHITEAYSEPSQIPTLNFANYIHKCPILLQLLGRVLNPPLHLAFWFGFNAMLILREKCTYSELFWSAFSRIRTEYGEILLISPYSVQMLENADQNNSEYGHFLRNVKVPWNISNESKSMVNLLINFTWVDINNTSF